MTRVVNSLQGTLIDTHTVGTVQPTGPLPGDLWLDTGATPLDLATQAELDTAIANFRRPIVRLDYNGNAADIANATAFGAGAWATLCAAQSFTLTVPSGGWLQIDCRIAALIRSASISQFAARLIFDTGQTYPFSTGVVNAANYYDCINGVSMMMPNAGFVAGTRTLGVQLRGDQALTGYLRGQSVPNNEWYYLRVVEWVP